MTGRYVIGTITLTSNTAIEISSEEYQRIIQAEERLLHYVDAEEKYDGFVENYRELEQFILDQAFHALFETTFDSVAFQAPRNTTARKLSNFLSSVRLYQDTIGRHAAAILEDESAKVQINAATSREYDSSLNYRILDALRNHAQHHALPIHGYSVSRSWNKDRSFSDHEFDPHVAILELASNPEFKKTTLAEIINGPEKLKLKPMIREYIESLSNIHSEFRKMTEDVIRRSLLIMSEARERLMIEDPSLNDAVIAAFQLDGDGYKTGRETGLSNMLNDYIQFFRRKNSHLVNFARRRIRF